MTEAGAGIAFCIGSDELQRLESEVAAFNGSAGLPAIVSLAWHLRQRDGRRALLLADRAQRLLGAAARPADEVMRARLHLVRAEVEAFRSRIDGAEHWLAQARALNAATAGSAVEGDAFLVEALVARASADFARELGACEQALLCFEGIGDRPRAQLSAGMRTLLRAASPAGPARDADEPSHGPMPPACEAYLSAARALRLLTQDPGQAAELFDRASEGALEHGLVRHAVMSCLNAADIRRDLSDFNAAAACLDRAELLAQRSQSPLLEAACRTRIGCLLRELGHLSASRSALSAAVRSFSQIPRCLNAANACYDLALTLLAMDLPQEAIEAIDEAISIHGGGVHPMNLAMFLVAKARIRARAGDARLALEAIAEAESLIAEHRLGTLMLSVDEALAEIHQAHPLPPPEGMRAPSAAIHHAERALQRGAQIAGWKAPASMWQFLAQAWSDAGDFSSAYTCMQKALAARELELAMRPEDPTALLRLLLRNGDKAGLAEPQTEPTEAAAVLTPKEREVVRLLAQHQSNKDIALQLGISGETVKSHLRAIYAKLKVGTRRHAIAWARNAGLAGRTS